MALLTLGTYSLMLFEPPNIVHRIFTRSFIFHLLSTGILIGSNFILPVPKFRKFLLTITPFLYSMIGFMMVFPLFIVLQENKEK